MNLKVNSFAPFYTLPLNILIRILQRMTLHMSFNNEKNGEIKQNASLYNAKDLRVIFKFS